MELYGMKGVLRREEVCGQGGRDEYRQFAACSGRAVKCALSGDTVTTTRTLAVIPGAGDWIIRIGILGFAKREGGKCQVLI
jgi:hypothetical protein